MQTGLNTKQMHSSSNLDSTSALDTLSLPRHRWYFVKEAFSPTIVSHAIKDSGCKKDDLIIDAFCGGGTVPLASVVEGYSATGFEVNPFLAFVSRTKLLQCNPKTLDKNLEQVTANILKGAPSRLETISTFSDTSKTEKWLFNNDVLRAFEGGWQATVGMYSAVRDLMRLCLIGAAMDVCNAVKDGKCLRYRLDWEERHFGKEDFATAFKARVSVIKKDLEECPLIAPNAEIRLVDSRKIESKDLDGRSFKLCIMSPPYLNSFDYTDIYRPELFLGKFVRSSTALQELRLKTLRSHVQVNWAEPAEPDLGQLFIESYTEIKNHANGLWNKRIPSMIQAYFEDIKHVLTNLRCLAKEDASIWIVVSTSAYAGVEIPVDLLMADIGSQTGWLLREVKVVNYLRRAPGQQWNKLYEKKNNRPHLRESIIILDAKPHAKMK
jgi:hypothetical protein